MRRCPICNSAISSTCWVCESCGWRAQIRAGIPILAPDSLDSSTSFDSKHFDDLFRLELGHPWFRWRNRFIVAAIARLFPEMVNGSFLEVGCGTGAVLYGLAQAFPKLRLTGSELLWRGLEFATQRHGDRVTFLQLDAHRMPFSDEFDLVGAFDVLEHIDDQYGALTGLAAGTRPGGGILLSVPQHPHLWSQADISASHRRRYRRGELEALAVEMGLEVLESTSFMTSLLPLMWFARRYPRGYYNLMSELTPGKFARTALDLGLGLDYFCYRIHIPLPVGGSRFIALRKPAR